MGKTLNYLYNPKVCPVCGSLFNCYCPEEWVYKIRTYNPHTHAGFEKVCSYHCMRKWQKEHKDEVWD